MKMKREEVLKILTSIFQNNFDDEKIKLTDATSSVDIEDWDYRARTTERRAGRS